MASIHGLCTRAEYMATSARQPGFRCSCSWELSGKARCQLRGLWGSVGTLGTMGFPCQERTQSHREQSLGAPSKLAISLQKTVSTTQAEYSG